MKNIILVFITTLFGPTLLFAQQDNEVDLLDNRICNKEEIRHLSEYMPSFTGSKTALIEELNTSLGKSKSFKKLEGKIAVRFVITCKGEVVVTRILKGINESFDDGLLKALRASNELKSWKPAKQEDEYFDNYYNVQITIRKGVSQKITSVGL